MSKLIYVYLFSENHLEGAWVVNEVVAIHLGLISAEFRFTDIVVPSLAGCEVDGVLFCVEMHFGGLHVVTRRRVANGGVFPFVCSGHDVPVESPSLLLLPSALSGRGTHFINVYGAILKLRGSTADLAGLNTQSILVDMQLIRGGSNLLLRTELHY